MGVHGLWKLLEPVGKAVPLEGMAGKVLAVDVSIWLHQAMKGMHDTHGAPIAVAHLLILFQRLCKLLYFKIKPVFVFDGGVPALKRETMATRRNQRTSAKKEASKVREKLFKNLLKHEAVRQMLSHGTSDLLGLSSLALPGSSVEEELYKLPPLTEKSNDDRSDEEGISEDDGEIKYAEDIYSIDVTSSDFKGLAPEIRHEILLELIETRKQNSWKNIDAMPKESDSFSDFQMNRLLKRRAVQSSLDEVGKEMGGTTMTMKELESLLLNDPLSLQNEDFLPSKRIAQSDDARFLLLQKDDEIFSKVCVEEVKSDGDSELKMEVKEEKSSGSVIESPVEVLQEIKQEELSQEEIYNIIKKENAPKLETKLSKDRKMKLTDNIIEILPLLGAKGAKIENFEDCSELLLADKIKKEKDDIVEMVEDSFQKEEEHKPENAPEPPPETGTVEDNVKKVEAAVAYARKEPENPIQDSAEFSEESEDDFVAVRSPESTFQVSAKTPVVKTKKTSQIEIVISTEKGNTETDDIFADIFAETEKIQAREEVGEKGKEPVVEIKEAREEIVESAFAGSGGSDDLITPKPDMTERDLQELQKSVEVECCDLIKEQWRQERYAQSISDQMNLDAQELLRLFGVPYVVAPMEAEAQCAILDMIGLTDGTITDDSDIWLFGGKVVYRNFFNQKKHVQQYRIEDIERYFKLSREDLIRMAILVGSDYTSGLEGVGPVTALEILGAFPSSKTGEILSGLKAFRDWISSGNDIGPTKRALRRKIKNAKITPGFPSESVVNAYMQPEVDDSKEPFSWSKPNVPLLQKYAKIKFGWNQDRSDELLTPVMKKLNENKNDTTLEKYFKPMEKESFAEGVLSKRVENALRRLRNEESTTGSVEAEESEPEKNRKKICKKPSLKPSTSKAVEDNMREGSSPQKRAMEIVFEQRKRSAIQIFKRTKRNTAKRKGRPVVRQELDLSESSNSS